MRDYKNVRVPRSYRNTRSRGVVKRVDTGGRGAARSGGGSGGFGRMLLSLAVVVLAAGSGFLAWQGYQTVMHADMFIISGVDIRGVQQLGETDLKEIVSAFTGQNIFRVDLEAAARRARANPRVRDVRIHRSLPNRITMVFTERSPFAVLEAGTMRFLMDEDGTVIERLSAEQPQALPVIAVKDLRTKPGDQVATEGLSEAVQLLRVIAARGGWQPAQVTVKANSPESLSIVYAGVEFKMGNGRYPEKLRRLAEVMSDVRDRGLEIASVDLRPERQVAVMVKKSSTQYKVQSTAPGKTGRKTRHENQNRKKG